MEKTKTKKVVGGWVLYNPKMHTVHEKIFKTKKEAKQRSFGQWPLCWYIPVKVEIHYQI
jgi:hypothetical protein